MPKKYQHHIFLKIIHYSTCCTVFLVGVRYVIYSIVPNHIVWKLYESQTQHSTIQFGFALGIASFLVYSTTLYRRQITHCFQHKSFHFRWRSKRNTCPFTHTWCQTIEQQNSLSVNHSRRGFSQSVFTAALSTWFFFCYDLRNLRTHLFKIMRHIFPQHLPTDEETCWSWN